MNIEELKNSINGANWRDSGSEANNMIEPLGNCATSPSCVVSCTAASGCSSVCSSGCTNLCYAPGMNIREGGIGES